MGWKSTGEEKVRFVFSYFLLPSLSLSLSLDLKRTPFAVDWPLIKDHTPSAGESARGRERERRSEEVWRIRSLQSVVTSSNLGYIP